MLTHDLGRRRLRIELTDAQGKEHYVVHDNFVVEGENNKYMMTVGAVLEGSAGSQFA